MYGVLDMLQRHVVGGRNHGLMDGIGRGFHVGMGRISKSRRGHQNGARPKDVTRYEVERDFSRWGRKKEKKRKGQPKKMSGIYRLAGGEQLGGTNGWKAS